MKKKVHWKPELDDVSECSDPELVQGFIPNPKLHFRYFYAQMIQKAPESQKNHRLGLQVVQVENCIRVLQVSKRDNNAIAHWNRCCAATFPDNIIKKGDYFVSVNGFRDDSWQMLKKLGRFSTGHQKVLNLVVCRDETRLYTRRK